MDFLDDFLSEPSPVKAPATNRFKPKAKPQPRRGPSVAAKDTKDGNLTTEAKELVDSAESSIVHKFSEDRHLSADTSLGLQSPENIIYQSAAVSLPIEEIAAFHDISFASASPFRPSTQTAHDLSTHSIYQDSVHLKDVKTNNDASELWINIEEGAEGFSCLEDGDITSEVVTVSGKRPIKFHPKPKAQIGTKKDAPELSSENQHMNEHGSIYIEEPHIVSDFSNAKLDGKFSMSPTTNHLGDVIYEDADSWMAQNLPEQCGDLGQSMGFEALNSSDKSLDVGTQSLGSEANEDGYEINGVNDRVHDNSRAKAYDQSATSGDENNLGNEDGYEINGVNDGVHDNSCGKAYDQSATSGDENNLGNKTSKKKRGRKSKKVASENDESGSKKSKIAKVPDQSADKPVKKVPRAPRRKRCVDKTLLEAPEDELDLQRVPIRDLIILAEYKERQGKKNAAAVPPSLPNERVDNTLSEDPPCDDYGNSFDFDQDGDGFDNPSTSAPLIDTGYFNYHSFMDKNKTTKLRWSKDDTELFYQGIREFGSDFLMIQKMHFPGRTRHQIKLKYKKEERENPMMLHGALNSRAKDLSHFEILAQRLQKEAAQKESEDQMCDEDNPTMPTGEEEGMDGETLKTHATLEEVAKAEKENETANQELDAAQEESLANSYDNEDDINWDDYKSEL